jgi:hypothetical protein
MEVTEASTQEVSKSYIEVRVRLTRTEWTKHSATGRRKAVEARRVPAIVPTFFPLRRQGRWN